MIRHVAVFRWSEGATAEQIEAVATGLAEMVSQVPTIRAYSHGPDLVLGEGRWDYAVVADFDDPAGYQAYVDHPAHQRVATGCIAPIRADRAHVQLQL